MELEHIFSYRADLNKPIDIGKGSAGVREIMTIKSGKVWGSALNGKLLPVGGEFMITDDEGRIHIDVRLVIETEEGVPVYVQYSGVLEVSDKMNTSMAEKGFTEFGDAYFMTRPRFECGDEKYQWLNNIVAVAEGRLADTKSVEYRVYQCVHSASTAEL